LLNSFALAYKNIKSITEFESWGLLVYYVGTGLVGMDHSRLKLLVISRRVSVYNEWYKYDRS